MKLILRLIEMYTEPKGVLVRNSLSFGILIGLAPMVAVLSTVSLIFIHDTSWIQLHLSTLFPVDFVNALIHAGNPQSSEGLIPFLIATGFSFYAASRAFYASMVAFSVIEKHEPDRFVVMIQSIIATIVFIATVIAIIIANAIVFFIVPDNFIILSFVAGFGFYLLFAIIFFVLISHPLKKIKDVIYGAITFAAGLNLTVLFYNFYITYFNNYSDIYGSFAWLLIMLLTVYWLSNLIYFSYIVNMVINEKLLSLAKDKT